MAAERDARFLPRHNQEVLIREAPRGFRVVLLIAEAQRAMIVGRQAVGVEIAQADHIEADRLHRHQILKRRVEPAHAHPVGHAQMEMVDERFVAWNRLEHVVVRERERSLPRRFGWLRADVEEHLHLLPRARRRVVQRVVLLVLWERIGFGLGHRDADAVRAAAVVAIEDVPEVHIYFARKEERMRRRERRDRTARPFRQQQSIGRADSRKADRLGSAELMLLRMSAGVAPGHAWHRRRRESLQTRVVLVGHRRLVGPRNGIHLKKVRSAIDGEPQVAVEDAELHPREGHREAGAVALDLAR